ncbi:hypothetical protein Hypma_009885 [Hypsizygus marmoreus]|uniref:Uncharacterized protein n=1 Tax=Hypsizygus marmoreus TaxID=39966 RepID=A0A369JQS7_HYPMA|nr:hypothetical protein Hypma_009885 [Hypsizygus marmoreus]
MTTYSLYLLQEIQDLPFPRKFYPARAVNAIKNRPHRMIDMLHSLRVGPGHGQLRKLVVSALASPICIQGPPRTSRNGSTYEDFFAKMGATGSSLPQTPIVGPSGAYSWSMDDNENTDPLTPYDTPYNSYEDIGPDLSDLHHTTNSRTP